MRFLIYILFVVLLISCSEEKLKPLVDSDLYKGEMPDQIIFDAKISFKEEGKLKAILYADTLRKFFDNGETFMTNMKIDFYNKKGMKESRLTSKFGKVDDSTQDMYAIGNVVAKSDSGVTLLTEELKWENKRSKIVTEKFVTILDGDSRTEGYGFESDQNLVNYKIFNPTYVTTNVEDR